MVDEVLTLVAPMLLGDGVRSFNRPGGNDVKLERSRATPPTHVTNLWFRVVG